LLCTWINRPHPYETMRPPSDARSPTASKPDYHPPERGTSYYPSRWVSEMCQTHWVPQRKQRVHYAGRQGKTPAMGTFLRSIGFRFEFSLSISVLRAISSSSTPTLTTSLTLRSYYSGLKNGTQRRSSSSRPRSKRNSCHNQEWPRCPRRQGGVLTNTALNHATRVVHFSYVNCVVWCSQSSTNHASCIAAMNSYSPVGLADRAQGDRARRRWGSDQLCSDSIFESLES